ncbi:hypothetical protein [Methyloceanibacter stevinii]|uniref:hypothetical protein n=1 Tax=Methyloceanibacter stevinii TaxID=1774970 RepID=UPI00114D189E|nr:hypothetical protein [Methyloceanibacter stevinii]
MTDPKPELAGFHRQVLMEDMMETVGVEQFDVVDLDGGNPTSARVRIVMPANVRTRARLGSPPTPQATRNRSVRTPPCSRPSRASPDSVVACGPVGETVKRVPGQ